MAETMIPPHTDVWWDTHRNTIVDGHLKSDARVVDVEVEIRIVDSDTATALYFDNPEWLYIMPVLHLRMFARPRADG